MKTDKTLITFVASKRLLNALKNKAKERDTDVSKLIRKTMSKLVNLK